MRRSSRPRIRPLEFWNLEKADYSVSQDISYKLSGDTSTRVLNSTKVKNPKGTNKLYKPNGIYSENNKTDKSKRKKQFEEDEEPPSITSTKEYKSRYNLKSLIVVVKKLKTHQDRIEAQRNDIRAQSVVSDIRLMDIPVKVSSIHPEIGRRSGRIRKKPLEFWNFETAEVKTLANGEVFLVFTQCIDSSSEVKTVKRGVLLHPAFKRKGKNNHPRIQKAQVGHFSPSMRKLFSHEMDTLHLPVEKHESPTLRYQKSLGRLCTCDSEDPPHFTEFKSLRFREWETNEFKCFFSRNYRDLKSQIYSGFLFLAKGKMMWITDNITTLFVICGEGTLKFLHSLTEEEEIILEEEVKTTIPVGKKVLLEISDGSSDMLRLFLAFQKVSSSTSPSS